MASWRLLGLLALALCLLQGTIVRGSAPKTGLALGPNPNLSQAESSEEEGSESGDLASEGSALA